MMELFRSYIFYMITNYKFEKSRFSSTNDPYEELKKLRICYIYWIDTLNVGRVLT
jgi:hypothetical protein